MTGERRRSQDSDDLICLHGSHSGPGKQLLVAMSLCLLIFTMLMKVISNFGLCEGKQKDGGL